MENSIRANNSLPGLPPDPATGDGSLVAEVLPVTKHELEDVLAGWWAELLAIDQVSPEDDFFDLGGDSLGGAQLLTRIKDTYGVELRLSILFDARNIRQLSEVIEENISLPEHATQPWCRLLPLQPAGSRPPLYWIPGGNGTSVLLFKEVSLLLGADQPSYGLEAKMPEPDEEFESIPERSRRFINEIRALQPHGPYALLGFCGGGYVAYEMAQQLVADGQQVNFLAIVECADDRHPSTTYGKLRFRADRGVWRFKQFLGRGPRGMARWGSEAMKSAAQSLQLRARQVTANLVGKSIPPLPAERVDLYAKARRIVDRYQPLSYRGTSLVLISEGTYPYAGLSSRVDPRLFWCRLCQGGSEVKTVPGDHTDILKVPLVERFAEVLKDGLKRHTVGS